MPSSLHQYYSFIMWLNLGLKVFNLLTSLFENVAVLVLLLLSKLWCLGFSLLWEKQNNSSGTKQFSSYIIHPTFLSTNMYFLRVYYTLVTFGGWQRLLWVFADIFDLFASPGKSMREIHPFFVFFNLNHEFWVIKLF